MSRQIHIPPALVRFVRNATRASIGAAAEHTAQIALMPEGTHTEANLLASIAAIKPPVTLYCSLNVDLGSDADILLDLGQYPFVITALEDQYPFELSRLQELPSDRFTQPTEEREQLREFMARVRMAADTSATDER